MSSSRAATSAGRTRKAARSRGSSTTKPKPKPRAKPKPNAAPKPKPRAKPKARRPAPKRTASKRAAPKRATPRRSAPRRTSPRRSPAAWFRDMVGGVSWRYRLATIAILAVTVAAGYFLWLRDSSLVAIDNVDVVGVTAGERAQIIGELTEASESMTTLHVDRAKLDKIAAQFPTVASIHIDPNFPHGMRIEVTERPPTMVVKAGEQEVAVAGDGTVLTGVGVSEDDHLPVLELDNAPTGAKLSGLPLEQALVVGAAPDELRPLIEKISESKEFGVEVTLRGDIPVRFGTATAAGEKWAAAASVLADPKLETLSYLDVRVPERPAVGNAQVSTPG